MAWQRSGNPWVKRQRRQCALVSVGLVVMMFFGFTFIGLIFSAGTSTSIVSGIFAAGMFLAIVSVFRQCAHEWRVLSLVPEHDAMVCPKCLHLMEAVDELSVRCPKGHATWPRVELLRYWEQYGLARKASWLMLRQQRRRFEKRRIDLHGSYRQWLLDHPAFAAVGVPIIATGVYCGGWLLLSDRHWIEIVRFVPFMALAMTGGMLLSLGSKQRRGNEPRCAACDYERVASQEEPESRCPECGAVWNEPGATVRGTLSSRRGLIVAGLALLLCAAVVMPLASIGPMAGFVSRVTPTSLLIESLGRTKFGDAADWTELNRRQLSPDQRDRLASLLLEQRRESMYFSVSPGCGWLETEIANNSLPGELSDRYFREALKLWIDAPDRVRTGEEAMCAIEGDHRLGGNSAWQVEVAVDGFRVDGSRIVEAREDRWRTGLSLDTELRGYRTRERLVGKPQNDRVAPVTTLRWERARPRRITFAAWVVIRPSAAVTSFKLDWNKDGTPVTPADALRIIPVTFTHTIDVVE